MSTKILPTKEKTTPIICPERSLGNLELFKFCPATCFTFARWSPINKFGPMGMVAISQQKFKLDTNPLFTLLQFLPLPSIPWGGEGEGEMRESGEKGRSLTFSPQSPSFFPFLPIP